MTQHDSPERFTILRELGRGATGTAYSARDRSTGATVALKTLDPALLGAAGASLAEAFLKNAHSASRLRHANIVKVVDAGEIGGTAFVASELVEGKTLRQLLDERPLPLARAIRIFDDVASALAYAHEEGMVHRGVRPSRIFVLPSGLAKLADFGIGQIGDAAQRYQSPEQVRGEAVDHRADLFSLGVVFYEMLTRHAPFGGDSPKEIRESILRAEPLRPSEVNPHVPGALDALVLGLLARRPEDRVANARLLLRDLQRIEDGLGLRPAVVAPAATVVASAAAPTPSPAVTPPPIVTPSPRQRAIEPPLDIPRDIPRFSPRDEADDRYVPYHRRHEPERRSPGTALAAVALALAVMSLALTVFFNGIPEVSELRTLISRFQEGPAQPPAKVAETGPTTPAPATPAAPAAPAPQTEAPLPTAELPKPPATVVTAPVAKADAESPPAPKPSASSETPPAREVPPPKVVIAQPAPIADLPPLEEPPPAEQPPAAPAKRATPAPAPQKFIAREPPPPAAAKLVLSVSPGGEVYVDGIHHGTTPPITTLELAPGMRRIEIRNGSRRPYLNYIVVEPGEERRIRYDFNARGRPPA